MRDDVHPKARSRHLVYRKTYPIERDRALRSDKGSQVFRCFEDETDRLGVGPPLDDPRKAIDMAQNEMPAELVAKPQRLFEIDRCALLPRADRRARQGLRRCLDREFSARDRHYGEAYPGAGDRGPDWDGGGVESGGDRQIDEIAAAKPPHLSEIRDDAGKHASRLRVCLAIC